MSEEEFIRQVNQIDFNIYNGPKYYSSGRVVTSLTKLFHLRSEAEKWDTYNDVLSDVGNNHAGTYYPVVMEVLPLMIRFFKASEYELVRNCILEMFSEWYFSFGPELGAFTLKTEDEVEDFVRTSIKNLITDTEWSDSERNMALIMDFKNYFADEASNPLLTLKFDRVCMYDYEPGSMSNQLIANADGIVIPQENIKKVVELDTIAIHALRHILGETTSYGDDVMRCFIPHLAFAFFREGLIVFHVSICLTCNNLRPSIEIPAHTKGRGMTHLLRTFLNNLLDKHGFSNNVRLDKDRDGL